MKDKALIEKAFEQFMEKELGFIPNPQDSFYHLHKKLWLECATWQREQLEGNQTKIKCSRCGVEVSSSVPKDTVIRGYVECPECIAKTNVATVTHDIYKQARIELIKEFREWIESNKELRGYTGIPDDTLNIILAKLDLLALTDSKETLLEGEK